MPEDNKADTELYKTLQHFYRNWNFGAGFYLTVYVVLGILAVLAPLAVAAFTSELGDLYTRVLAFIGALSVGLLNSINFIEKASNFRLASDHLNASLILYQSGNCTQTQLVTAYNESTKMIGRWRFIPTTRPH